MKKYFMVLVIEDLRISIAVLVLRHIEFYAEPALDDFMDISEAFRILHLTKDVNSVF